MVMTIIIIVVPVAIIAVIIFNRLIRLRNLMQEAWSGIDVQLKRRYNLIPNIVETVKGYMQHERKVLEEVTSLRSKITDTSGIKESGEGENRLSKALKSIFALAEAYPDLKANQGFINLHKNLAEIEDQIQLARRYYNGTVRNYNISVESFPGNLVAQLFNFKKADFFEIEYATEREVPDVKFGS